MTDPGVLLDGPRTRVFKGPRARIDTGPPGNGEPPTGQDRGQNYHNSTGLISHERGIGNQQYSQLLLDRWAAGLLELFFCHRCGEPALDPCGRDGKHEWLCARCADSDPGRGCSKCPR